MLYATDTMEHIKVDQKLFLEITDALGNLHSVVIKKSKEVGKKLDGGFECHSICRALSYKFKEKVSVIDGDYVSILRNKENETV